MSGVWSVVAALIPSAGVAFLFYYVIKYLLEGDRRERIAQARWETEQDRAVEASEKGAGEKAPEQDEKPSASNGRNDS